MDDRTTTQQASNQDTGSGSTGSYSWLEDYQSGNYDRLPESEITGHYRDWSRTASPDELYEATYHGYQSYPQDQLGGTAAHLYNTCQVQGLDLSDLNLSSTDYQQWNAEDMARVTGRAYGYSDVARPEQTPAASQTESKEVRPSESKSGGGMAKPLIGLALAGALAFAASRVIGSKGDKDNKEESATSTANDSTPLSTGGTETLAVSSGATGLTDSLTTSSYGTGNTGTRDYTASNTSGTAGSSYGTGSTGTSDYTASSTAGIMPAPLSGTAGTASMPSEVISANEYVPGGTGAVVDTTTETPLSGSLYGDLTGNTVTGEGGSGGSMSGSGSGMSDSSGTTGANGGIAGGADSRGAGPPPSWGAHGR